MRQLIYLAILLSIHFANGQNNFRKGYIVTTAGDTITGEIKFNWNQKPTTFTFRQGPFIKSYSVDDVSAFQIKGGDRFVQKTVAIDVSPTAVDKLLQVGEDPMESMSLFLKVILLGEANLYQSYDEERQRFHYFIETKDTEGAIELIENRRKIPRDTDELRFELTNIVGLVKTQDRYKNQLTYLLQGCDRSLSDVREMKELKQETIIKVIERFNACQNQTVIYRQNKSLRGTKIELGVLAGAHLMDISASDPRLSGKINTDPYLSPTAGLDLQFSFSNRRILSLGFIAYYSQLKTTETFFESRNVLSGFSTINYEWEQLTTLVKFNFNFGGSERFFFANAGYGLNWIANAIADKTFDTGSKISIITQDTDQNSVITVGGGYQHKKLRGTLDFGFGGSNKYLLLASSRTVSLRVTYFIF